ncbi:hypothetical protein SIN8267_00959 [Sinobacterium norvegicum]|uniref:Small multi-drug export protein n=1 Tax=Sinobacterium norvegicum TaxID=1641715 RepID=A0ABN8EFR7_9GAMM|nr:small multi-drug export protein [Sinobacterium norvegicum]CAH0990859.1 hypothetical protein SIN8267_00959 [Sinobacterium norvegicum]
MFLESIGYFFRQKNHYIELLAGRYIRYHQHSITIARYHCRMVVFSFLVVEERCGLCSLTNCRGFIIYFLEANTIILLSLWKTYLGPALAVGFGMGYIEAVGYTLLGAAVTVFTTLAFERRLTRWSKQVVILLSSSEKPRRVVFKPKLRRALRFYRRYGFWGLMILTPILIGLPVGVWIAVRLGTAKLKVAISVLLVAFIWSTLSYAVAVKTLQQLAV